jgi:hypothetical protein
MGVQASPLPEGDAAASVEKPLSPAVTPSAPVDIFSVRTWQPIAPVVPVDSTPVAPPKPEAPPLPFRFLGKIVESEKKVSFLLVKGGAVISVRVGENIGSDYRVEKYSGNRLYFIYRPLKVRQSLFVGYES